VFCAELERVSSLSSSKLFLMAYHWYLEQGVPSYQAVLDPIEVALDGWNPKVVEYLLWGHQRVVPLSSRVWVPRRELERVGVGAVIKLARTPYQVRVREAEGGGRQLVLTEERATSEINWISESEIERPQEASLLLMPNHYQSIDKHCPPASALVAPISDSVVHLMGLGIFYSTSWGWMQICYHG
jgi:hypothetical protein